MRAVIVSIGSELIDGFLTDTNATFLAREMAALGIELVGVSQVGDDLSRIVRTLKRAWDDADLIVTTGGIGPTEDDLTREAVAELIGEQVAVDPELLRAIEAFFKARGTTMPEQNSKQAWLVPSAEPLPNPMGTAPGWFVRRDGHTIATMPGVPREMTRMWAEQVVPRVLPLLGKRVVVSQTLKTIGIGESAAERLIAEIIRRGRPIVATYAKDDGVHIRITASAPERQTAESAVEQAATEVRAKLGSYIYGLEPVSLSAALIAPLRDRGLTLAIAEAGSGGRLASLIAEEPAADAHYRGGYVRTFELSAGDHRIDPMQPGSPREVAQQEAAAVRAATGATVGLAIAVQLVPGSSPDQTQGHIALCFHDGMEAAERQHQVTAIPSEIRRRTYLWAAEFLRSELLTLVGTPS